MIFDKVKSACKAAFFKGIQLLPRSGKRKVLFLVAHRYPLPRTPKTFSEKVQWRILYDRRPLLEVTGDKLAMKRYAERQAPEVRVPRTLWTGTSLEDVYQRDFGVDWVLKPISGSGVAVFGSGSLRSSGFDLQQTKRWTHRRPELRGEWVYERGAPGYLIEERIPTEDGLPPKDIKVFVFNGVPKFIYYAEPRTVGESHRFYSLAWEPLDFRRTDVTLSPVEERPAFLDEIVQAAAKIGAAFDFIRIDFFSTESEIFFGELTPYPAGGLRRFHPRGVDREIGDMWHLPQSGQLGRHQAS